MREDSTLPPPPESERIVVAGKYRLTRLLGRGGMGAVWEGVHETLKTRVAVKLIEVEHVQSRDSWRRFENEARAAARLQSKHVVEVYDHGVTDDGRAFIVMQYLQGEPLDTRLVRLGVLTPPETARIILQICRALTKAHALGIIHRDLKPENVFLVWDDEDQSDIVKVVDFGIAKFTEPTTGEASTRTGSVLGTPFYMSPEQARGLRTVDHRSDLWSVGVIAYRCLVGKLPFEGESVGDVLVKLCTGPIPVPSAIAPDLPVGFDAWIARALSREMATRFASASELAETLAVICGLPVRAQYTTGDIPIRSFREDEPGGSSPAPVITPRYPANAMQSVSTLPSRDGSALGLPEFPTTDGALTRTGSMPHRRGMGSIIAAVVITLVVVGVGIAGFVLRGATDAGKAAVDAPEPVAPAAPAPVARPEPPATPPVAPTATSTAPEPSPEATSSAHPRPRTTGRPTPKTPATAASSGKAQGETDIRLQR